MISYTLPEIRRLLISLVQACAPDPRHVWSWSRWRIEECFQQAKNEAGLDHYQVRSWRAWYAHITLSMLALAWLVAVKSQLTKGEPAPANST